LKYSLRTIWRAIVDASQAVQLILVLGAVGGIVLGFWTWIRDRLINMLSKPPIQWHTEEMATGLVLFLLILSFASLAIHKILNRKKSRESKKTEGLVTKEPSKTKPYSIFSEFPTITDKSKFLDHPTQADIAVKINSQPPYLVDETAKAYTGLLIHWWQLSLCVVINYPDESVVSVFFDDNSIEAAIDTKEYPIIKTATRGTQFDVWAEITEIQWPKIHLGVHMIELHKRL
jgi:hypothetical protein